MKKHLAKTIVTDLLELSGIRLNGDACWDLQIHNEAFYARVLQDPDLGLGESFVEGWWDCERIDLFIARLVAANLESKFKTNLRFKLKLLLTKFLNFQTKKRALQVGIQHYDLSNELFQMMLGDTMNYTCGYWKNADTLDKAQCAKMELTCQKLLLKPGMRLLDIGCGWGGLAKFAAENYGVTVVGITISQSQYAFAKERCKNLPIDIRFQDYRDVDESFDRIVSLGMFEHVGYLNYGKYMQVIHRCLKEEGLFLLHTIGGNLSTTHATPWISTYVFPNGMIPSIAQIGKAAENRLIMEDWHNFGLDYYNTLMAWHHNFNQGFQKIAHAYDDRFFRMWNYYLLSCAGEFKARDIQLWQIVFSKTGWKDRYEAAR